jgi:SMC interacting uncharacterized protein involved in chromosome segregation
MIAEVYDAFRSAGADDDKARAAAIALSEGDRRFDDLQDQIGALGQDLRAEIQRVESGLQEQVQRVESGLQEQIQRVERGLQEQIQRVERGLQEQINRLDRRLTVLEWNVRLNSVILIGLLLKLIVFG